MACHRRGLLVAECRSGAAQQSAPSAPARRPRRPRPTTRSRAPPARASACASRANLFRERVAGHSRLRRAGSPAARAGAARASAPPSSAAIPASVANQRSVSARAARTLARELGQRRGDHLAERVVVVLRGPLEQLHDTWRRSPASASMTSSSGLSFSARHFRASSASECTTPMRRWRPKGTRTRMPGCGSDGAIARRQVIEQSAQRRIERDAQDGRVVKVSRL